MVITILNKNKYRLGPNWYTRSYDVDEAPVYTTVKNETLDSATVVISNQNAPIEIEPFDIVKIENYDYTPFYMCVDTYTETLTCVNPKIYKYEIHLFSETKQLEGVVLPNLKITKVFGVTRSINFYINRYMKLYSPKIYVNSDNEKLLDYKFKISSRLADKFANECPEMQWNQPTLREVLNDLMMVNDCIPILKNGVLDFMDLTTVNPKDWASDTSHINYVTKSKSSEDYVSEIQVKLENVTNEFEETNNLVRRVEWVPFSVNDTDVSINTKTAFVKTKYPIYKLKSLKIMFPATYKDTRQGQYPDYVTVSEWMEADLCSIPNLVCEYQEFLTRKIYYPTHSFDSTFVAGDSQNTSIYYTRNTNKIENFFSVTKLFPWFNIKANLFTMLIKAIVLAKHDYALEPSEIPYYKALFKVEYETLESCLFRASKTEYKGNDRVIIDHQTNSMVDSYKQGFLEYQKANRLGNEQLQINARFNTDETVIKIGDVYGDTLIYQCQYQYYKDHIEVNALATKNYILQDYFTGVKSKIRSWAIATGAEALTRNDLNKVYFEFSYNPYFSSYSLAENVIAPYIIGINDLISLTNYYLSPLESYPAEPLNYCFVKIDANPESYSFEGRNFTTYYNLDLMKRIIGNSIILSYGFDDNALVERSVDIDILSLDNAGFQDNGTVDWADTINYGGLPLSQHKYVNNQGEAETFIAYFTHDMKTIPNVIGYDGEISYPQPTDGWIINTAEDQRKQAEFYAFMRPRALEFAFHFVTPYSGYDRYDYRRLSSLSYIYKDSQEIINIHNQIEFCSDTVNICIGKEWLKRQKIINENNYSPVFGLRGYDKPLNFRKPNNFPEDFDNIIEFDINIDSDFPQITIVATVPEGANPYSTAEEARNAVLNRKDWSWYLYLKEDGTTTYENLNEPILLGFTDIPGSNVLAEEVTGGFVPKITLFMNYLGIIRNKNTYNADNHYLIDGIL